MTNNGLLSVELNESHLASYRKRLAFFSNQMRNPTEANRQASVALYGFVIRNFQREGGLVGGWVPVTAKTAAQKSRIGKERLLVRSGHLKASFRPFYSREQAGVGSELIYSRTHQLGDPARNIPARRMLPDAQQTLDIGVKIYGLFVEREAKRANA